MQAGAVVHDLHGAAAEHVAGADHHRIADALGDRLGFLGRAGDAVLRLAQAEPVQQVLEAFAVLGDVDRVGAGAEDGNLLARQRLRQFQRRLPAVLHDAAEHACRGCCSRRTRAMTSSAVSGSKYSRSEVS